MNSLIITVCVLIEATVIIAEEPRFSTTKSPHTFNEISISAISPTYYDPSAPGAPDAYSSRSRESLDNVNNQISIVRQTLDGPNPDGSYSYSYETDNGIQGQEDGHLINVGTDQETLEVRGSYSYTEEDINIKVSYVANENGFQPEDYHLPSVPPLVKEALQYRTLYKRNWKE